MAAIPSTSGASGNTAGMDDMIKQLRKAIGGDESDLDAQNVTAASLEKLSEGWAHRSEAGRLGQYFDYDAYQPNVQVPFVGYAEGFDTQANNINNDANQVTFSFSQEDFTDLHNSFMRFRIEVPQFMRGNARVKLHEAPDLTYVAVDQESWNEYIFWKDGGPIKLIESIEVQWMTGNNTSAFSRTTAFGDMIVAGWKSGVCNQRGWEDVRRRYFPMRCDDFPKPHWRDFLVWKCVDSAQPNVALKPNQANTEVEFDIPLVAVLPPWYGMGSQYWPIRCTFNVVIKLRPWMAAVQLFNPGMKRTVAGNGDGSAAGHEVIYTFEPMLDTEPYLDMASIRRIGKDTDELTDANLAILGLPLNSLRAVPKILDCRTFLRTIKLGGSLPDSLPAALVSPSNYFFNLDSSFPSLNPDLLDYTIPNGADKDITVISTMNSTFPQMLILWFYDPEANDNTNWFKRTDYSSDIMLSYTSPRMNPTLLLAIDEITISYKTNEMEAGSVLIYNWKRRDDPNFEMAYWRYQQNMKRMNEGVQHTMSKQRWLKEPYIIVPITMEGFADFNTALCSNGSVNIRVRRNNTNPSSLRIGYLEWVRSITTINNQYALTNATLVTTKGGISRGVF